MCCIHLSALYFYSYSLQALSEAGLEASEVDVVCYTKGPGMHYYYYYYYYYYYSTITTTAPLILLCRCYCHSCNDCNDCLCQSIYRLTIHSLSVLLP